MDEHLGYEKYQAEDRDGGNSRNGRWAKTVLTEIGPVTIEVPRDIESTFEPQIVSSPSSPASPATRPSATSSATPSPSP
jgi:transposase-like protein